MAYEKSRWLTSYGTPLWTTDSISTLDNWNSNDWTTYIDPSGWSNSTACPPAFQWNANYNDFIPPSTFEDLLTFVPQSLTSKEIDELTKFYQATLKEHMADSTKDSEDSDQDYGYGVFFSAYQECQLILKDEKSYLEKKFQDIENEINDIKSQMLFASAEEDQTVVTELTLRLPALEGKKSLNSSDRYEVERLIATAEHRMLQFEKYLSFKLSFKNSPNNPSNISWKLNPVTGNYEGIMAVDGYVYTLSMDLITNEMNTTVTKSESGL